MRVRQGDAIVFPRGDRYVVTSDPKRTTAPEAVASGMRTTFAVAAALVALALAIAAASRAFVLRSKAQ